MVVYNISAGHNPDGKKGCGAVGLLKESTEARYLVRRIIKLYKKEGFNDIAINNFTVNNGKNQDDILKKLVAKHNSCNTFLNISIHLNSGRNDKKGDGSVGGVEVYYTSKRGEDFAKKFCNTIASLGFTNRGAKKRDDLYFLNKTLDTAILIEVCFVDDKDDYLLYNKVKKRIANKIYKTMKKVSGIY